MRPWWRKLVLTAHIASSVGWLGAVMAFLAIAIIGLASPDVDTVRGAYLVMEPAAWFVLVPLSVASLVTGIIQSLGTTWGLFRHYWVVFKLVITVVSIVLLLNYMESFEIMARAAAESSLSPTELGALRNPSPALHAALALGALLVAAVLSVYKPQGRTPLDRAP